MRAALRGVASLGLITTVLPAAIAPMTGPRVSWKGKLNALDKLKYLLVFLDSLFLAGRSPHVICRTYPITNTQPSGSFLIFGLVNLNMNSISGAFSSFTQVCKLRVVKTISFRRYPISAVSVSKTGLFRS
jgi:hypothetical protein